MRIAVISTMTGFRWGGSEELWATTATEAIKEGAELTVSISHDVSIPYNKFTALKKDGVQLIRRRPPLTYGRVERVLSRVASPFRETFRFNPDVICISQGSTYESLFFGDLLDLLYSTGIPYVVVCQYNDDRVLRRDSRDSAKKFFERAFRVVFVSRENMKSLERQLAENLANGTILQNPVNLFDLTPVPWPSSGQVSLASVARLQAAYKGQDVLLEALSSDGWCRRDWRLRLYGEGPDRKYLEALVEHYGIAERVEFCGHIHEIRSIWEVNHLLVLPSRGEGTPLSLVEAMLCGRPAVVTDVGGNAEWTEDDQTGFVAEAATAKSFRAALERAWAARAKWQVMGKQARDTALTKFDKSAGKSLLKVLLEAASQGITADSNTAADRKIKYFCKPAVAAKRSA
jgi:glycosyltransferase involved in cell wall biosynthesis